MALKHALLIAETIGGAKIHFKCGRQPASIALSAVTEIHGMLILLVLPNNTTIDGGGLITLDGSDTATVVFVDLGTTAVLNGLIIINGVVADILGGGPAGGIVNFGTLTIYNGGTLKIKDSTFSHNNAGDGIGGAIYNDGTLTVGHSTFSEYNVGTLKINHITFSGNSAFSGGGLFTHPGSFASLTHKTFSGNFGFEGGGIANSGALKINHGTLSGNAGGQGGGIFNADTLALNHSIITHNTANLGGGIYICLDGQVSVEVGLPCHGTLTLRHTSVTGNTPDDIFP